MLAILRPQCLSPIRYVCSTSIRDVYSAATSALRRNWSNSLGLIRRRLSDQQQRIGRVTRPARFPNHDIESEGGEVVGIRIGLHVFGLIRHLRIGPALVAGFRLHNAGIAFDSPERERARAAAGDADGARIVPTRRAEGAVEIARPGILPAPRSQGSPTTVEPQQGHKDRCSSSRSAAPAGAPQDE